MFLNPWILLSKNCRFVYCTWPYCVSDDISINSAAVVPLVAHYVLCVTGYWWWKSTGPTRRFHACVQVHMELRTSGKPYWSKPHLVKSQNEKWMDTNVSAQSGVTQSLLLLRIWYIFLVTIMWLCVYECVCVRACARVNGSDDVMTDVIH